MPPISPDSDRAIQQILWHCGQQARDLSAQPFEVIEKAPKDFVTSVDRALDQQLTAAFADLFPGDGIITEENARSRQRFTENYARLWCIDPIDGTEDFIRGKPDYSIMIGLLENAHPIGGWIHAPATELTYWGGENWGIFQADATQTIQLTPHAPKPPSQEFCPVIIGHRDQAQFGQAIVDLIPQAQFYSLGSFGLKVIEVVLGRAGLYVYFNQRVKIWDTAGPIALANAAGLVCCDLEGRAIGFTPGDVELDSLAHKQPILIGWPSYVETLRPKIKQAVNMVRP